MSPAVARILEALRVRSNDVREEGTGWIATCPAHDDHNPSLRIGEGTDGRVLLKCRAKCTTSAVVAALGLQMKDLFAGPPHGSESKLTIWKIQNATGAVVAEHHRIDYADGRRKKFFWMSNGSKGLGGVKVADLPLYGVVELLATPKGSTVILVEGEKAADALRSHDVMAVATVTGANVTPSTTSLAVLTGFRVVIWPDHDEPGREHMRRTGRRIAGIGADLRQIEWPEGRESGDDAADFFARGGTVDQLRAMIDNAPPHSATVPAKDGMPEIRSDECLVDELIHLPRKDDPRPQFQYEKGKGHEAVEEACRAIAEIDHVFERGHELVRIVGSVEDAADDSDVKRAKGMPVIAALPVATLWELLSRARQWVMQTVRSEELIPIEPPQRVVAALVARASWPGLRRLVGLVGHPVLRADGTILNSPGYDPVTGLYLYSRTVIAPIPERPTMAEAVAARELILDVVSEFKFASPADQATWFAAMLTPIARPAFEGPAPLFLGDASTRSSGKTLLCDVISMVATGFPMPRSPYDERDEEIRKRILAHGIAGDTLVLIDNVPNGARIGWPSLDAALTTTDVWKDRVLGKSENAAVPLRITWFATGNNIGVRADAARRVLKFRLEPVVENPEEIAGYKYPRLLKHVRDNRGRLLAAALTILRGYITAGRPKQLMTTIGSYENWSDLVQAAVVWSGLSDPAETLATKDSEANPDDSSHIQLLSHWPDVVPDGTGTTTAELLATLKDGSRPGVERLREAVLEICPGRGGQLPDARSFGTKLRSMRRRWRRLPDGRLASFTQDKSKTRGGMARWRIEYRVSQGVQGQQGVPPAETATTRNESGANSDLPNAEPAGALALPRSAEPAAKTPSRPSTPCGPTAEPPEINPSVEPGQFSDWELSFLQHVERMEQDSGFISAECDARIATVLAGIAKEGAA